MKYLPFFLVFGFASVNATAQRVAQVQIMTSAECDRCKRGMERLMALEKGVLAANLDLASRLLTVVYRPNKTSVDKLLCAVAAMGYAPDSTEAETRTYNRVEE